MVIGYGTPGTKSRGERCQRNKEMCNRAVVLIPDLLDTCKMFNEKYLWPLMSAPLLALSCFFKNHSFESVGISYLTLNVLLNPSETQLPPDKVEMILALGIFNNQPG